MKSTKYQLLESEYDFVRNQLKQYREIIEQLREDNVIGRLATVQNKETVYVVWNYYDTSNLYLLLELDRPNDGEHLVLNSEGFHLLEPLEIVERVMEWK